MATPTAASPRGVRSGLCCFFFRFLAQKPVETFCDWLIYFIFFYPGGLQCQWGLPERHSATTLSKIPRRNRNPMSTDPQSG